MKHFMLLGNVLLFLTVLAPLPAVASPGPEPLARIAARLGIPDPSGRVVAKAAAELHRYGQAALPGLLDLLRHGDTAQRCGGAVGLALLPMPAYGADGLLAALADPVPAVRALAAHTLAVIGAPVAPDLTARLAAPEPDVRNGAAYALMLMRGDGVPALARTLASDDPGLRAKAAWLLGRLGRPALPAIPALVRALDCPDFRVMHVVAEAIELIGPEPGLLAFHLFQLDARPGHPLARLGAESAPILVRLLTRPGTLTGRVAFRTLAAMGRPAVPALEAALDQGTPGQRIAAALLLVEMNPNYVTRLPDDVRETLAGAGHK